MALHVFKERGEIGGGDVRGRTEGEVITEAHGETEFAGLSALRAAPCRNGR
jgi:hypothetical protein